MRYSLLAALGVIPATLAAPLESRTDYAVHSSHFVPEGWERLSKPQPDHHINLRIGLKQGSFDELERQLYEVSDPNHARYGQHLSSSDVHALTAPSDISLNAVRDWLAEHNIAAEHIRYSPSKDWFNIALPVSKVERLLDTEYYRYQNDRGEQVVRTTRYSLPRSLHAHIDTVQPTNYFSTPKTFESTLKVAEWDAPAADSRAFSRIAAPGYSNIGAVCNNTVGVTSLCVRTLYNTVDYVPQKPELNYAGTTNYLDQTPSLTDFKLYMAQMRPGSDPEYGYTSTIIANATNDQTEPGVEANLDVQAVGGIIYPTRFTTWLTGGSPPFIPDLLTPTNTNEPYLTWLDYVMKQKDLPYVITTSYGDDEQTVPRDYAKRVCAELAQLGARGITLLFSSGDNGVGKNGTCVSNDGSNTRKFLPSFPASCPYVTTVGGTRDFNPERVAFDVNNGYVAGGGWSEYFPRPDYQKKAVSTYLSSIGDLSAGLYNPKGRAYPDIAAQGYRFSITYDGTPGALIDGTSVASPVAAGVLTLVNDALLAAGKPTLGFLNPLLYSSNGKGYNDITVGSVAGCETSGFPAKKGWDAATGWGTPDFKAIRKSLGV